MIHICGPIDKPPTGAFVINTTSRSKDWGRDFSPFLLGPVDLYADYVSENVENAYQFSKVYQEHTDSNNNPTEEYFQWAEAGWQESSSLSYGQRS